MGLGWCLPGLIPTGFTMDTYLQDSQNLAPPERKNVVKRVLHGVHHFLHDNWKGIWVVRLAVAERLSKLEAETGKLRAKLAEKDLVISELQDRVMDAEGTLQETTSRLSAALDEHSNLSNEKNLLVNTVKKLNRDVAKFETFKRTLMQSLQDDGDDHKAGFATTGDSYGPSSSFSPERPPVAERPPPVESKLAIPLSLPSSRSTAAPNANSTAGRTPRVDGNEFFQEARNRLSYEQFRSFLSNFKELNARRQPRDKTLRKADKSFGPENWDLVIAFGALFSRVAMFPHEEVF